MHVVEVIFMGKTSFVKVCKHNDSCSKLVLKSPHPDTAQHLCTSLGINTGKQWQGSSYFITEVEMDEFFRSLAAIPEVFNAVEHLVEQDPNAVPLSIKCPECGSPDESHWAFCPFHPENGGQIN